MFTFFKTITYHSQNQQQKKEEIKISSLNTFLSKIYSTSGFAT